ncbi:hypothetical protein ABIE26_002717 [Pedobacter africanus]|uniref:Uncharacterized protein n=1 Tax=Pedobacter africanus TaxID=151894 RepID=A0ACC6KX11_9SPHI|nr:hypothetical protein [Pedobacter africanus]MDR6783894.1 hypothetical protein [Pedobacter africanus]
MALLNKDSGPLSHLERLNIQLSIEQYVDRFIVYMSLYFIPDADQSKTEKKLQTSFEEFLFNVGYYPISESVLKNGRLDTLAVNQNQVFLFEIKQFDLGRTKEGVKDLKKKLRGAQIQSSIYSERLRSFPRLSNHIFFLLFTNEKVILKDNINRVPKDNLVFVFKVITLNTNHPWSVFEEIMIDVNDLLNTK